MGQRENEVKDDKNQRGEIRTFVRKQQIYATFRKRPRDSYVEEKTCSFIEKVERKKQE